MDEIIIRVIGKSYPAPHCGRKGERGGSAPRDECAGGQKISETSIDYAKTTNWTVYDENIHGDISRKIRVPKTERWNGVRRGLSAIEKVHYINDEKVLPIPLKETKASDSGARYGRERNRLTGKTTPRDIMVNLTGDITEAEMALHFIHETGHWLDHVMFGGPDSMASELTEMLSGDPFVREEVELFDRFRTVVEASQAFHALSNRQTSYKKMHLELTANDGTIEERNIVPYTPNFRMYAVSSVECWARAYSQYIALRANDSDMRAVIDKELKWQGAGQAELWWEWDDYEPVAQAIDKILEHGGYKK